ncbi:hypothetical protein SAMN05421754_10474 [Nitrosomonas sp. Nm58]|nr:hypothetical protein SAMN05421754_10474 [Nitrosomonas sp. Nm58]
MSIFRKWLKILAIYVLPSYLLLLTYPLIVNYFEHYLKSNLLIFRSIPSNPLIQPKPDLKPDQMDWSQVSSCIASESKCVCYGKLSEQLSVPSGTCRNAVKRGWSSRPM